MIENLSQYFMGEQDFYLQNMSYRKINNIVEQEEHSLNCIDNIKADVEGDSSVILTITRCLKFEPEELFELTISFGAVLKFNPEKQEEHDWHNINLAEEFKYNGEFVLGNLMSRISLLISQITSSYGQPPLVLPPGIANANNN